MTLEKLLGLSRHSRESGNLGPQGLQQLPWTPAFRGGDEYARDFQSNGKSEEREICRGKNAIRSRTRRASPTTKSAGPRVPAAASASPSIGALQSGRKAFAPPT